MKKDIFYHSGELIYRLRWVIIFLSLLAFTFCVPILPNVIKPFTATGFFDEQSESARTNTILNEKLGYSYNRFVVLYHHPDWFATDSKFNSQIHASLSRLKNFPLHHHILYPETNPQQISADKHTAYAVIMFKSTQEVGHDFLTQFNASLSTPPNLTMKVGGEPVFLDEVSKQTQRDLSKAEYIGTPAAVIILLIIFGSVVAALLPILLGVYCAVAIVSALYLLGHVFTLSIFTINIALLVGLCLSLDYALFFISRFRAELELGQDAKTAIALAQATAGKAIFFSGITVLISLSALLFFPINILFSVGIGGLTAVSVALTVALVLLPAILSILDTKINFISIRFFHRQKTHYWKKFITLVVNRAWTFFCVIMIVLLTLSYPVLSAKFGISNFRILPQSAEGRQFYDIFENAFGKNELSPILVVVHSAHTDILSPGSIAQLYDFTQNLKKDTRIDHIDSIVTMSSELTKKQYQTLYRLPKAKLSPPLRNFVEMNATHDLTVITIISKYPDTSSETKALIYQIRHTALLDGLTLQVTGTPANTTDVLSGITSVFPYACLWILIFTYLVLLVLLRSVILPLKAIITTILSLGASYGVLVFIIQQGHFHQFMNFEPQGMLDISLCIIIVCALFGFSMDYEVFLLARIKECYEITQDTTDSIISGIDQSSRIITSAAIIVILICVSFMFADVLIVKAFGLGIAIAIFVDAFFIRMMLVPATMALLGRWNWYLPEWVNAILPKVYFHPESR
jgi:RND superfamily putative drug exporter